MGLHLGNKAVASDNTVEKNNFWVDKTPCWVLRGCVAEARHECPAYLDQSRPCWELGDTLCKKLFGIDTCFVCDLYKRYYDPEAREHPSVHSD